MIQAAAQSRPGAAALALAVVGTLLAPSDVRATGFTDLGYDVLASTDTRFEFGGSLRLRSAWLHNLDLDRGPTPSGELLFPVSLGQPTRQDVSYTDLRLRTDFAFFAPGGIVGVKVRLDVLDDVAFGGSADGIPGGSITQDPPIPALVLKRAYGEVVTPIGYLAAGRMGSHWGLGMLANGGDCADCDSGDAADRVVFATTLIGHIWAVAYDLSSTGYLVPRKDGRRYVDVEPSAMVHSVSFALLKWHTDASLRRRRKAGKTTLDYGVYYAHRWQQSDIPAAYLPIAHPVAVGPAQLLPRDLSAHALDGWIRVTHPWFRLEMEVALLHARVGHSSSIPGFELPGSVESTQLGLAFESEIGPADSAVVGGLDIGFASGDPAPGFGARPALDDLSPPQLGDLDGPQAMPPHDRRIDNFRFHSDYRVDRILFRELIGTVTDAVYLRPHVRWRLLDFGSARLDASLSGLVSFTTYKSSAPGLAIPLGVELDPTISYHSDDGFAVALEYAVLFPLAGLDNAALGLDARPAQLLRVHLAYGF